MDFNEVLNGFKSARILACAFINNALSYSADKKIKFNNKAYTLCEEFEGKYRKYKPLELYVENTMPVLKCHYSDGTEDECFIDDLTSNELILLCEMVDDIVNHGTIDNGKRTRKKSK